MQKTTACLWFDGHAEEAANFYVSLLPDSRIDRILRSPADFPSGQAGQVLTVELHSRRRPVPRPQRPGPGHPFTDAVSFQIHCEDQGRGEPPLVRSFRRRQPSSLRLALRTAGGLSWQIVPVRLWELMNDPDPARAKRAMEAMMEMDKIDIATLERAVEAAS